MTPFARGSLIRDAAGARSLTIDELAGSGVLVLAPHPDDETLGCGGAIAAAVAAGKRVVVVAVTDGRRSHPGSQRFPGSAIAGLRRQELAAAVRCLGDGAVSVVWLGYLDQEAPAGEAELDRALHRLAAATELDAIDTVWASFEGDPHVDHQRTAALARRLQARLPRLALWSYPVWGRFIELPGQPFGVFDTACHRDQKARAMAAHRSQMTLLIDDDPGGFVMTSAMQAHFLESAEIFIGAP